MANFLYTQGTKEIGDGNIDWINDDIRVILVDDSTSADTEEDAATISGFTTLGELSGTGYSRKVLASKAVTKDDPNDRTEWDAADVLYSSINAGTAQAAIIYKHVNDDSDSIPIAYIDQTDFPIITNGGDVTLNFNAEGIVQLQA